MRPRQIRSFTLVELLVVISIIAILAGLVLGGAGAVRQRAARSQAKAEVSSLEAALARYQMDVGVFPTLTVDTNASGYSPTPSGYVANGGVLFAALWGSSNFTSTTPGGKQYLSAKASMVNTSAVNYFIDPWGKAYGYYWDGSRSVFGGAVPDVWSTGGQSGGTGQTNRAKWITSWE